MKQKCLQTLECERWMLWWQWWQGSKFGQWCLQQKHEVNSETKTGLQKPKENDEFLFLDAVLSGVMAAAGGLKSALCVEGCAAEGRGCF